MSKFTCNIALSFVFMGFQFGLAQAAPDRQITFFSGKILVNIGHGFFRPNEAGELKAGDRVLIGKDSSVTVFFDDANCSVSYAAPSIIVVPNRAPCKSGDMLAAAGNDFAMPANMVALPVATAAVDTTLPVTIGLMVEGTAVLAAGYATWTAVSK